MGQLFTKSPVPAKKRRSAFLSEGVDRSRRDHKIWSETGVLNTDGYQPLFDAAVLAKDWITANLYLEIQQNAIKKIFKSRDSAQEIVCLQLAAANSQQWTFMEKIVKMTPPKALEAVHPESGFTVLHMVTIYTQIKLVKALVKKNARLTQIFSRCERVGLPLNYAIRDEYTDGQREVMEYLASVTKDEWAYRDDDSD